MKKLIYVLACIVSAFACTQTEKAPSRADTEAEKSLPIQTAEYALPLDSAVVYAKRYDSIVGGLFKGTAPIKAYTIRATDLLEAMGVSRRIPVTYNHIRVYLGIDLNNKFRLLLTPVENANIDAKNPGKDVILDGPHTRGLAWPNVAPTRGEYVLDFTAPCPNSCPVDSPLNQ